MRPFRAICLASSLLAFAERAEAHGFGQRYDLPMPLPVWLGGAAASLVLSFVVAGAFLRVAPERGGYPQRDLLRTRLGRILTSRAVAGLARAAVVLVYALTIAAGLFGQQAAYRNLAPTMIWVIGWVGLAFASALVGDVWLTLHPLRTVVGLVDWLWTKLRGQPLSGGSRLPEWLGAWPAVGLFIAFAWCELVWSESDVPYQLGKLGAAYSAVTLGGMFLFGRDRWLRCADPFTVAFGVFAQFSPVELRPTSRRLPRAFGLRPPGVGLLESIPVSTSRMLFILLMLATVTYDGFLETGAWLATSDWLSVAPAMQEPLERLRATGLSDDEILDSIGFVLLPMAFVGTAWIFAWLTLLAARISGAFPATKLPSKAWAARSFVSTLVPIAIAYHLAHYLSMLAISGQYLIPLASDPFGFGWNLLGTANFEVDIGIIGVRFVWYSAATAIVTGHVVAVVLAHFVALRAFENRRAALWSQVPMLGLMIGYTTSSLWILAQPIVE